MANISARVLHKPTKVPKLSRVSQHVHQSLVIFLQLCDFNHIGARSASLFFKIELLYFIFLTLDLLIRQLYLRHLGSNFVLQRLCFIAILLIG